MACTSMVLIFLTLQFPVDFLVLFDPISIILNLSMVFFGRETWEKVNRGEVCLEVRKSHGEYITHMNHLVIVL